MIYGYYALLCFTYWSVPCPCAIWADLCNSYWQSCKCQVQNMPQQEPGLAGRERVWCCPVSSDSKSNASLRAWVVAQWSEFYHFLPSPPLAGQCTHHLAFSRHFQVRKFCVYLFIYLFSWIFLAACSCIEPSTSCSFHWVLAMSSFAHKNEASSSQYFL